MKLKRMIPLLVVVLSVLLLGVAAFAANQVSYIGVGALPGDETIDIYVAGGILDPGEVSLVVYKNGMIDSSIEYLNQYTLDATGEFDITVPTKGALVIGDEITVQIGGGGLDEAVYTVLQSDVIVPSAFIKGPSKVMLSDDTAAYTFSLRGMPSDIGAVNMIFQVEDKFFFEQELVPLNGWAFVTNPAWELSLDEEYWTKSVVLSKAGGSGDVTYFDFFQAVLGCKDVSGTTAVELVAISVATPGSTVVIKGADMYPQVTVFSPYSKYDVNEDGVVDLADIAAAAYFFMAESVDLDWTVAIEFDDGADGFLSVTPVRCDVNDDDVVDIEDLILILNNFS